MASKKAVAPQDEWKEQSEPWKLISTPEEEKHRSTETLKWLKYKKCIHFTSHL